MSFLKDIVSGPECQVNPVKGLLQHYERDRTIENVTVSTNNLAIRNAPLNERERAEFQAFENTYSVKSSETKQTPFRDHSNRMGIQEASQWISDYRDNTKNKTDSFHSSPLLSSVDSNAPVPSVLSTHPWHLDYLNLMREQQKIQSRQLPQPPSQIQTDTDILATNTVDTTNVSSSTSSWVNEYLELSHNDDLAKEFSSLASEEEWLRDFQTLNQEMHTFPADFNAWVEQYRRNIASLADENDLYWNSSVEKPWLNVGSVGLGYPHWGSTHFKEYIFQDGEELVVDRFDDQISQQAMREGIALVNQGQWSSSIPFFEKAVKYAPNNANAWFQLAKRQAELERDELAIAAYQRALNIQPDLLACWLGLATSLVNENCRSDACDALVQWLTHHPNYNDVLKGDLDKKDYLNEVIRCFIKTVQRAVPMDVDVQTALGLLFHMKGEYDKAVDCFRAALTKNVQDPYAWNKLGATLANNRQSEEAIEAYHQALKLCPGYVRARYNLGISCINLGAYKEASEHLLSALALQQRDMETGYYQDTMDEVTSGIFQRRQQEEKMNQMSRSVWDTLKVAFDLWNRHDLVELCNMKDINVFKRELDFV